MCLVALALQAHPRFPLVLASNRDEFFSRPTEPMHWWPPMPGSEPVLAGRDTRAGGSWLALNRRGRLALLTNLRGPGGQRADAPSRGGLVTGWVQARDDAAQFCAGLAGAGYNGFNLLTADRQRDAWHWYAPDRPAPLPLAPGLWGLSNAALDTPWPKLVALKSALADALSTSSTASRLEADLLAALADDRAVPDDALPATGVPLEVERALATIFIRTPDGQYGTRCSTVIVSERTSEGLVTTVIERSFAADRSVSGERRFVLDEPLPG